MGISILAHGSWKAYALLKHKKIELWNKRHFVENKAEIMQHVFCCLKTAELGYNVMTGTEYFVPVKKSVVLTEKYNVTVSWN